MTTEEPLPVSQSYKKQKYKNVGLIQSLDKFTIIFDSWNWIFERLDNGDWSLTVPNGNVLSVYDSNLSRAAKMILEDQLDTPGIEIKFLKQSIVVLNDFRSAKIEHMTVIRILSKIAMRNYHDSRLKPFFDNHFKSFYLINGTEDDRLMEDVLNLKTDEVCLLNGSEITSPEAIWAISGKWRVKMITKDPSKRNLSEIVTKMLEADPELDSSYNFLRLKQTEVDEMLKTIDIDFAEMKKTSYGGRTYRYFEMGEKDLLIIAATLTLSSDRPWITVRVGDRAMKKFGFWDKLIIRYHDFISFSRKSFLCFMSLLKKNHPRFHVKPLYTVFDVVLVRIFDWFMFVLILSYALFIAFSISPYSENTVDSFPWYPFMPLGPVVIFFVVFFEIFHRHEKKVLKLYDDRKEGFSLKNQNSVIIVDQLS